MLKTLSIELEKSNKNRIKVDDNRKNKFDGRNKVGDNKVSSIEVKDKKIRDNKVIKKKNH